LGGDNLDKRFSKFLESDNLNLKLVFQKLREVMTKKIYGFLNLLENHMPQRGDILDTQFPKI